MSHDRQFWIYMLRCADGSYYVGSHRGQDVRNRVDEHQQGADPKAWTARRRPVALVYAATFQRAADAVAWERQLKGWGRKKKEAAIDGRWADLPELSQTRGTLTDGRVERFLREHSPREENAASDPGASDLVLRQAQDEA